MDNNIKCPSCGVGIPLTEALTGQIEAGLQAKYQKLTADASQELTRIRQDLEASQQAIVTKEQALLREKKEFSERVESGVSVRLQQERTSIIAQERTRLQQEQSAELSDLKTALAEKDAKVVEMLQQELNLRKKARELEEFTKNLEVESARKLDTERAAIKLEASRLADEAASLKLREKDNLLAQMQDQIEALKRKAETGSQEACGEAQEDILVETLSRTFPFDLFEEVAKGQRGGDIVQVVRNHTGKNCGRILWESKNTKEFSKKWLEKVKADQMAANANAAVIMTVSLPDTEGFNAGQKFGLYENVWITDLKSAMALSMALRQGIIEADKQRVVSANQDSLQALLYEYMTSKDTHLRINSVLDAVKRMEDDLASERRAFERIWASRSKQIEALNTGFGNFFGGILRGL